MRHDFIKTGDADGFAAIQDRNGEVVLGYCRRCRQGEGELGAECSGVTNEQIDALWREACGTWSHLSADSDLMHDCTVATNRSGDFSYEKQQAARMRIAAILNTRSPSETKE